MREHGIGRIDRDADRYLLACAAPETLCIEKGSVTASNAATIRKMVLILNLGFITANVIQIMTCGVMNLNSTSVELKETTYKMIGLGGLTLFFGLYGGICNYWGWSAMEIYATPIIESDEDTHLNP